MTLFFQLWNTISESLYLSKLSQHNQWGLCEYVIVHTILGGSPVILWISLGGKPKWLPLKFGYHDVMRTSPISRQKLITDVLARGSQGSKHTNCGQCADIQTMQRWKKSIISTSNRFSVITIWASIGLFWSITTRSSLLAWFEVNFCLRFQNLAHHCKVLVI